MSTGSDCLRKRLRKELGKFEIQQRLSEASKVAALTGQQIKYFKEKRVQDWKRDMTIKQIQEDDARMAAKAKLEKIGKGWFS